MEDDGLGFIRQQANNASDAVSRINDEYANVDLELTCFACPVQIEGKVDGIPMYFRSRWETWEFAMDHNDPVGVTILIDKSGAVFSREGECEGDFSASWMDGVELYSTLKKCIDSYFSEKK